MLSREEQRQATVKKVLDTADELFLTKGFAATTIRDIAKRAAVSVGTVMAVGDKNALLVQVFDSHIAAEHDTRLGEIQTAPRQPVVELLRLVRPFVELFINRRELACHYAGILASATSPTALFHQLAPQLIDEFAACVAQASDPKRLAQALYYAYVGIMFSLPARGLMPAETVLSEIEAVFTTICQENGA